MTACANLAGMAHENENHQAPLAKAHEKIRQVIEEALNAGLPLADLGAFFAEQCFIQAAVANHRETEKGNKAQAAKAGS